MNYRKFIICIVFLVILILPLVAHSQGNLLIFPPRVVFDGNKQYEVLGLTNIGSDTCTYMLSFIQYRMKVAGKFEEITEPDSGQFFADPYLRFFPRQVVLPPQETQSVRVRLRKPADMPPGEYRSHLYFRSVPKTKEAVADTVQAGDKEFSFKLTAIYGISIPVIIRHQVNNVQLDIDNVSLEHDSTGAAYMNFRCNRKGNISFYGSLAISHKNNDGEITPLFNGKGFSIYTPNTFRDFQIKLAAPPELTLNSGTLLVEFESQSDLKKQIAAKSELKLD